MALLESAQYIEIKKTVSGTVLFGDVASSDFSGITFASADDYDVFVRGDGFYDPDSADETGFDYTVNSGTVYFRVYPKKIGMIAQVS